MKRSMAVVSVVVAIVYFGYVRESEARALRRCRAIVCQPVLVDACMVPDAVAVAAPGAGAPYTAEAPTLPVPKPFPPVPPTPPAPKPPGKVHALLLVDDTNKDTGVPNKAGAALIEKLLREGLPPDRLGTIATVAGEDVNPDAVRARIADLSIGSDDTIVCYYAGAAIYNENTRAYLLTPAAAAGKSLPRPELRAELLLQKARLTVLLTDTTFIKALPDMVQPLPPLTGPFQLGGLLLKQQGIVDLHAASPNETAFTRGNEGGIFTVALSRELAKAKDETLWPTLFDAVRAETDRLFKEFRRDVLRSDRVDDDIKRAYREQMSQIPVALTPLDQVGPVPEGGIPSPGEESKTADLVVQIPPGVRLLIEGEPTKQTGATRYFETPPLEPGRVYTYTLRAEMPFSGSTVPDTRRVPVRAGQTVTVQFGS
jgi:uncharacterized protein (TIGR03000 family)